MSLKTHEVGNVVPELSGYNLYDTDLALKEAVHRYDGAQHEPELQGYGEVLGRAETIHMAELANRHEPELQSFDRQGHRLDRVEFHPAWHHCMRLLREQQLVTQPFSDPRPGAWTAYAAGFSMHGQIEAGSQCPTSMTFACIPVLQKEPDLFARLRPKLYSREYDARDIPWEQKASIMVGMGMTEKQGGSDVRANETRAVPLRGEGRGAEYLITGHKWFFSSPMSDAHLVVARTENGISCFFVPRYRPDGSKNSVLIQRLKEKVGNRSNSSSEVEFVEAWGVMVGPEGRGIPTIIEMAMHTRLNCVMASAGLIRQATVQAINYARQRSAFGKKLVDQPLMRNVLADIALESEAATLLMMRLTHAFASAEPTPLERALKSVVTPASKLWVAKRSIELGAEAMEVFGGNGYMADCPIGRLYRETPVISIWEGSGNVMALDMLRGVSREPEAMQALLAHLHEQLDDDARLAHHIDALGAMLSPNGADTEAAGRRHAQSLVLLVQAALMRAHAPAYMGDAFVNSRFDGQWGRIFGALPAGTDEGAILARAWPV